MSYWGSGPIDSDYAFNGVSLYVLLIKERMFKESESVIESAHPEQRIIASLKCIRLLARDFPKCVLIHFGRKDLAKAKEAFDKWYDVAKKRVPAKYREAFLSNAEAEFKLFEKEVLPPPPKR
jgi:hypothetical protein